MRRETLHTTLTFDEASGAWEAIFLLCFTTSPASPDGEVDTTGGDGEERDLSLETHVALLCWVGSEGGVGNMKVCERTSREKEK